MLLLNFLHLGGEFFYKSYKVFIHVYEGYVIRRILSYTQFLSKIVPTVTIVVET